MNKKYTKKEIVRYALKRAKGIPIRIDLREYFDFTEKIGKYSYKNKTDTEIAGDMNCLTEKGISEKNLPAVFALISEAAQRRLNIKPFPEQLAAGKILLENRIAQMQTGEGKTLAAVFAAVVQVKTGGTVHIFTANEYLAGRDSRWMESIYNFFGISVSVITEGMSDRQKMRGYRADVTYLTVKQAGFDYLRDCIKDDLSARTIPDFHSCIIDEADFIMIDEARTPLVIVRERGENYIDSLKADKAARRLLSGEDFTVDRRARKCVLSLKGLDRICREFSVDDSSIDGRIIISGINAALHARMLLRKDIDYIVRNDKIELIDFHTGRRADNREWPYGIQRALEAKEGVRLKADGEICGSITIENFIRLYPSVSAMTATAEPAAAEFFNAYGLETCVIPPHRPSVRIDYPDMVFRTKDAKLIMLVRLVREANARRQPVLIGTSSVRESDEVSRLFSGEGISHRVLNAKQDAVEAELISRAGEAGAVTVATNMAGRGTDILLGGPSARDAGIVRKTGGLFVIGLNRNESLRVDNQLRGRSGRQGDPGCSLFLMSLEDDLFIKYGIREFLPPSVLDFRGDEPLENHRAALEIARAQEIIEGQHAVMRRTLHNYSMVIEKYRKRLIELKTDASVNGLFPLELLRKIESDDQRRVTRLFNFELDEFWAHFLAYTDYIKEGIHLRRFGKREPLFEFIEEANSAFTEGMTEALNKISRALEEGQDPARERSGRSGSTWTYQIDDNPFPSFSLNLIGMDAGTAAAVGPFLLLLAPFLLVRRIVERRKKKL